MNRFRTLGLIGLFATALLLSGLTRAQEPDPTTVTVAQALYDQAVEQMDAKNFAAACPKLEQVTKLVPAGIGAKEALAECYEGLGRLAAAWSQYALVESMAAKAGESKRAANARAKVEELKPKLAKLTIVVMDEMRSMKGLVVMRDGIELTEPSWGLALPVDAGEHLVEVKAPGRQTWTKVVQVVADGAALEVKVPLLEASAVQKEEKPPEIGEMKRKEAPDTRTAGLEARPWMRPVGYAALGVGVVGVIAGGVLGGLALQTMEESNGENHCDPSNRCDATGLSLRQEALGYAHGSTAMVAIGLAVAAGGGALLWMTPQSGKRRIMGKGSAMRWGVGLSGPGWSIRGEW